MLLDDYLHIGKESVIGVDLDAGWWVFFEEHIND